MEGKLTYSIIKEEHFLSHNIGDYLYTECKYKQKKLRKHEVGYEVYLSCINKRILYAHIQVIFHKNKKP